MKVVDSVAELRAHLNDARLRGETVGVVPTMGALHEGHSSLIRAACQRAQLVVVTIFVNPTQFGANEDFDRYPRQLVDDVAWADGAGATVVFAPTTAEMYPRGEQTRVRVTRLSEGMCGSTRPRHFEGVATIVTKLMNVAGEGQYFFGRKDYQQLKVIERLACDLLLPVEVIGCPIVRESDGLALSSRNRYLSPSDRQRARAIPEALQAAVFAYRNAERHSSHLRQLVEARVRSAGIELDYVELRTEAELESIEGELRGPSLLGVAAWLGGTRLIDNVILDEHVKDLLQVPLDVQ